eukprot:Gregarina_sp_Pseudo_9__5459@NODE_68_length_4604_cov_482_516101_g63_i0_p3_GENE_NODE_68_length_4604_cov_482_516101_g63_i0NODE_68_length_4604_cov_482_516101_g63_i0_p3_ORF_typecomplete_len334_score85_45_NODE_68_length_4604_cov_482_516101_g63_i025503551
MSYLTASSSFDASSIPTPRPSVTRFVWEPNRAPAASVTPRLSFQPSPIAQPSPSLAVARNVTPLKRAPETPSPVWHYSSSAVYYRRQSAETPLVGGDGVSSHFRSHTPPPLYLPPVENAPVFGYRALSLPRSVTPPPTLEMGRVSVSLSPFMILRIKALVELCSISPSSEDQCVSAKVASPSLPLKSCLKVKKTKEQIDKDNEVFSEDLDSRMSALLAHLLEASKTAPRRNSMQVLWKANEDFAARYLTTSPELDSVKTPRLEFSPGATLICFDSGDKPRKIRENHSKHYAQFLSQQRMEDDTPPLTPKSSTARSVGARSLTPPLSRIVTENS